MTKILVVFLLCTWTAWCEPLGSVKFSTTGAGQGTWVEADRVDADHVRLRLKWKGRGGDRQGDFLLSQSHLPQLSRVFEQALAAAPRHSGKPQDFPVAEVRGNRLIFQNQSDGNLHVTYLILKPAGKSQWNDWHIAQVNLEPGETASFRNLLAKMQKRS